MTEVYQRLYNRMVEQSGLSAVGNLINYHLMTNGAPLSSHDRWLKQLGAAEIQAHNFFVSNETGDLIAAVLTGSEDPVELRVAQQLNFVYGREGKLTSDVVQGRTKATAAAEAAFAGLRSRGDFNAALPYLRNVLRWTKAAGELYANSTSGRNVYQALLNQFDRGLNLIQVETAFGSLVQRTQDVIQGCLAKPAPDTQFLSWQFPDEQRKACILALAWRLGLDSSRTHIEFPGTHPASTSIIEGDGHLLLRLTESFVEDIRTGIHEVGHAVANQDRHAVIKDWKPFGYSLLCHESQSRIIEVMLGCSRSFWQFALPVLRGFCPSLGVVQIDEWLHAINRVEPGLVRVQADELHYMLHIVLRIELELALITGDLDPAELPSAWNEKCRKYFDKTPKDHTEGCLQDVHWWAGYFGYFPTYALGSMVAAQLFNGIKCALPDLDGQIASGNFGPFMGWLAEHVRPLLLVSTIADLPDNALGEPFSAEPWFAYTLKKYSELYNL